MNSKKELLSYKGYNGSVEYSLSDGVLYGNILFIRDLVTYEADCIDELKAAFEEAVDDYLDDCVALGVEPNKPFTGTFQVRVGEDRHKRLAVEQVRTSLSINQLVCRAVDEYFRTETNGELISEIHNILTTRQELQLQPQTWGIASPDRTETRH